MVIRLGTYVKTETLANRYLKYKRLSKLEDRYIIMLNAWKISSHVRLQKGKNFKPVIARISMNFKISQISFLQKCQKKSNAAIKSYWTTVINHQS